MTEISTSILSIKDIQTLYNLEVAKTDYFHIDVMDGEFVEKSTVSKMMEYATTIKNISNLPLDVHLMVNDVESFIKAYSDLEPNIITFHYEADTNKEIILGRINQIKDSHARVGISIKPETPVSEIIEFLPYVHLVLIMTVEPGQGGQELIPYTIDKVKELYKYVTENNIDIDIEVDGGVNLDNAKLLKQAGANILVSGKAIIEAEDFRDVIEKMREA